MAGWRWHGGPPAARLHFGVSAPRGVHRPRVRMDWRDSDPPPVSLNSLLMHRRGRARLDISPNA